MVLYELESNRFQSLVLFKPIALFFSEKRWLPNDKYYQNLMGLWAQTKCKLAKTKMVMIAILTITVLLHAFVWFPLIWCGKQFVVDYVCVCVCVLCCSGFVRCVHGSRNSFLAFKQVAALYWKRVGIMLLVPSEVQRCNLIHSFNLERGGGKKIKVRKEKRKERKTVKDKDTDKNLSWI